MSTILVVGSINMDLVNYVPMHPLPGQTIKGLGTIYSPVGKGANQAVAAARAGGCVRMAGAIGDDSFGKELLAALRNYGVQVEDVIKKESTSGLAFITVDGEGENVIILSEGANGLLTAEDLEALTPSLEFCDTILLQNEIPLEITTTMIDAACRRGIAVFFNPAPAFPVPKEILSHINVLVLNETEAEVITGIAVKDIADDFLDAGLLLQAGVEEVIRTLGDKGSLYKALAFACIRLHSR